MSSLESVVGELRWSAARSSAVQYLLHAALATAGWILAVLIAGRLVPIEQAARVAAFGVPPVFALVAVAWIFARPRPPGLMRIADARLGLKERLSTAWERRYASGPMDQALRQDALEHAARAQLAKAFPVGFPRREALLIAVVAVASFALVLLPNPMDQVLSQRQADRASQSRAAGTIAAVQRKIAAAATPAPVDPAVQKILQQAQAKIQEAPNPRSALQNVTPAEQQLLQLSDPQTAARSSSAQNLANSLSTTGAGQSAAQAINASPSQGAQSLRNLAAQLQGLSPQQRADLAKALADAAQHAQDPTMASTLQQASSALAGGDLSAAIGAVNSLAGQLDALQQQQSNDQAVAAAINGLEAARQQLASQADRDAGRSTQPGASGSPSAGGSGSGGGSPQPSASGNGSGNGNGNGNGNGTGNGTGNGSGNGSGGPGGNGASGSGSRGGSAAKSTERVYVPGQPVPGQTETDPAPLGPGQDVPLTPYLQVIQAYQQAALDASGQSLIPGSERDLIRQYFSSLGEAGSPNAGTTP